MEATIKISVTTIIIPAIEKGIRNKRHRRISRWLTGSTVTRCTSRWAAHIASTQHGQEVNPQKAVDWLMGQNVR